MKTVATWFYADSSKERSYYAQVGGRSDRYRFQLHYWRCVVLFYRFLRRYNPQSRALFFTNVVKLPVVNGCEIEAEFNRLQVEHIVLPFQHQPPDGYCQSWRNQFYLFSIVAWLAEHGSEDDLSLILDSDCVIRSSLDELFAAAAEQGYMTFLPLPQDDVEDDFAINNLSKRQLGQLFGELIANWPVGRVAPYCQGEFLLLSKAKASLIMKEFLHIWPESLHRQQQGRPYFHEEAQLLSYLYCRLGMDDRPFANAYIRRLWTDINYARNVDLELDRQIAIWHLPPEKKFGFQTLFRLSIWRPDLFSWPEQQFQDTLEITLNLRPSKLSLAYRRLRFLFKKLLLRLHLRR